MPDDDGPKYLNTPETPVYHKSQILYGVDLARKQIARSQRVVVVEGYTDVMACHLAGVDTAVATCGTAFGEHVKVLRRLLLDQDEHRGEVIFTFDSDEAGRKAALRAFDVDQKFVGQTFVAVTGQGMDPCDLRIASGDEAVRDLVSGRIPLVEFVIRSKIDGFDLDSAEGRTNALRAAAPVIGSIPDRILRSGTCGAWPAGPAWTSRWFPRRSGRPTVEPNRRARPADPRPFPTSGTRQRWSSESLKLALQSPELVHSWFSSVQPTAFTGQMYAQVYAAVTAAGGPSASRRAVDRQGAGTLPDDSVRTAVRALAVESPRALFGNTDTKVNGKFAVNVLSRLLELDAGRRLREVSRNCSGSTRSNPMPSIGGLFADVLALEQYRRDLREVLVGGM